MKRILFLFLDGVGLGDDDPDNNPFAATDLPTLRQFTSGKPWLRGLERIESELATFVPTDANLGVEGRPQSATGQASILTGVNVPRAIGRHYGPKPTDEIRTIIDGHAIIKRLTGSGHPVRFVNAYPPGFFEALKSGKRLLSSNQYALSSGGVAFHDRHAVSSGQAMSADFTGEGWHTELGYRDAPLYSPREAGHLLANLASDSALTFFDQWITDYVGHRGTVADGIKQLITLDGVVAGLLEKWDLDNNLILITSDHGNLEDIAARGHTRNPVPTLVIGRQHAEFCQALTDLTGLADPILRFITS